MYTMYNKKPKHFIKEVGRASRTLGNIAHEATPILKNSGELAILGSELNPELLPVGIGLLGASRATKKTASILKKKKNKKDKKDKKFK